jgi:8-oxo-dGTP pyrophosphatase MutT (NUDIX family)
MRFVINIWFLALLVSFYIISFMTSSFSRLPESQDFPSPKIRSSANVDTGLNATLKRLNNGRAAVVIIQVVDEKGKENSSPSYLFQRKSRDYPILAFRTAVCLFGGNAESEDATPLETLSRELTEELPSSFVRTILEHPTFRYFGTFRNEHVPYLLGRADSYTFLCACYTVTISTNELPTPADWKASKMGDEEGSHELIAEEQLKEKEKYAWGYDFVFSSFLHTKVKNMMLGSHVTKVSDNYLVEWNV